MRPARNIPTEFDRDDPGIGGGKRGVIDSPHTLRLDEIDETGAARLIAQLDVPPGNTGDWEDEFRYIPLPQALPLQENKVYRLTMSTSAGDGDHFRDPAAFDGLPPLIHPSAEVIRSVLIRNDRVATIPAFADMNEDYSAHRAPVGPTLKFEPRAR